MAKKTSKKATARSRGRTVKSTLRKTGERAEPSADRAVTTLGRHTYIVTYVPSGCSDYAESDIIELLVSEPPPNTVVLNPGNGCDGMTAVLES